MDNTKEQYRKKFRNCEQDFKEKLFLSSFDLITLNISTRVVFQFFIIFDFLFLAYYPLDHTFNRSYSSDLNEGDQVNKVMGLIFLNFNPADRLFNLLSAQAIQQLAVGLIIYTLFVLSILVALIFTRNKKKLAISSQKKFFNKLLGLIMTCTNFFLFVPILSLNSRMFFCYSDEIECYRGAHLAIMSLAVISYLIQFTLILYSNTLMTSGYPNETIPWSHFPSSVPFLKPLIKMATIFVYQIDQQKIILLYANAIFTVCMLFILYQRLTKAQTFDQDVHKINIFSEAILMLLFFAGFLSDVMDLQLGTLFSIIFLVSIVCVVIFTNQMKDKTRLKFLKKIDIFNYRHEQDALKMMVALHELIETSQFDEKEEFLLRGFIERHIEICDYPECNCMEYFKIINSTYRMQLATVGTMKEDENNKSSIQNTLKNKTFEDETTHDDNSMQKTFFVKAKSLAKQNKQKTKFMNNFLVNNIKVFLELFPNSVKLRYMSAFIYFNLFKNSFKALYELSFTNTLKSSLGEKYDSYTLGLKIIQYFQSRVSSFLSKENKILDLEIDLKEIIEFEKLNIKYQKHIEQTSEIAEQFWMELNKKNINIDSIFRLGCEINSQFHQIKKKYKKLMSINSNYLEVAYLYKLFVSLCLNYELEETEAKMEITKILQSKGMKKKNLREEFCKINFADENGMIIISGSQKDFSKILAMNNKAERIFGYNTSELINNTLTKLQPMVYGFSHDDFILNYINSKRKINKEKHNFVWGKHKSGFIMPLIMDISPYVTFEYNLCFIAFCKRSILLEMYPLKEIIDAQDVFVLLADQRGVITDMTRNITEWLGFPLQALNKEISLEQIFDGILDEEREKDFQDGKKIDFFMNSFKDALDDFENRSDDEFESTLYMKEKKCRALVWMKIKEHQINPPSSYGGGMNQIAGGGSGPPASGSIMINTMGGSVTGGGGMQHPGNHLIVREIWFVLLEEEEATATNTASFLETKNTHESALDKEELKFTYQEDREEICSLASVSSLAGYGTQDKGLISKLSEIKTSTVEESKPRSISMLQKTLVVVFFLAVISAIVILSFAINNKNSFQAELENINNSKFSSVVYQNMQILIRELVNVANGDQENSLSSVDETLSKFSQNMLQNQVEEFREYQTSLDSYEGSLHEEYNKFKNQNITLFYVRRDGQFYILEKSQMIAFYEVMTNSLDISQVEDIESLNLPREVLNEHVEKYEQFLIDFDPHKYRTDFILNEHQRMIFFLLINTNNEQLSFFPMTMSDMYIQNASNQVSSKRGLLLVITIIAISITFFTSILIIPIILRIESNKEKVFFIYAELNKNDVDDRKRNIRIFFAKLRQSTNNPGGSLFYQKSSRIVSSRLLTKRFSMKDESQPIAPTPLGLTRQQPINQQESMSKQPMMGEKSGGDYEEDMRAEMIKQQEELEAAVFKKFFHRKIKQMSCLKKIKYIIIIMLFAALVQGYFILAHQMNNTIDNSMIESLDYYDTISSRIPLFSQLITYYRATIARNQTFYMSPDDLDQQSNTTEVNAIDEFANRLLNNERKYNSLRQNLPDILIDSESYIKRIEGNQMCSVLEDNDATVKCSEAQDGILKQGMTQTINTLVREIIQSKINFELNRDTEEGLEKLINNNKIKELIFLKLQYLDEALKGLVLNVIDSIENYFSQLIRTIVIIFVCFLLVMIIGVIVSATLGMNFLYKNFNATKSILNLIPGKCLLELSEKTDLKKIQF